MRKLQVWLAVLVFGVAKLFAVAVGDARDAVVHEMGTGGASIVRGEIEVLTFAGVAKVRLERGIVVAVEPLPPLPEPALLNEPARIVPPSAGSRRHAVNDVSARQVTRRAPLPSSPQPPEEDAAGGTAVEEGVILLAIQTAIFSLATLVALVPVCRYWEVDMFASGYLMSSLANGMVLALVLYGVTILAPIRITGMAQLVVVSIFTIPTLVTVLQRFSFNRDLGASVRVAFMANACAFAVMIGANATLNGIALTLAARE